MKSLIAVSTIVFPQPQNIVVNMMPFIIGDHESLPSNVRGYSGIIDGCKFSSDRRGRVGYLTIHESLALAGGSQRRGGVHTEAHPTSDWGGGGWGGKNSGAGLYMASSVGGTCRAWDAMIEPGPMGDCEHLRGSLGDGVLMQGHVLYWMTDRTPHEALKVERDTYRQFVRVVSDEVGVWYADHSTPNPSVTAPCRIIHGNKFA